jgi:hypothetical protein
MDIRDHLVSEHKSLREKGERPSNFPLSSRPGCERDGRDPLLTGALEQELSIVRALLTVLKAVLTLMISLCCKHTFFLFLAALGFELRASHLLGSCFLT